MKKEIKFLSKLIEKTTKQIELTSDFGDESFLPKTRERLTAELTEEKELLENILKFVNENFVERTPISEKWLENSDFKELDGMSIDGIEDHYYALDFGKYRFVSLRPFEEIELEMSTISVFLKSVEQFEAYIKNTNSK